MFMCPSWRHLLLVDFLGGCRNGSLDNVLTDIVQDASRLAISFPETYGVVAVSPFERVSWAGTLRSCTRN